MNKKTFITILSIVIAVAGWIISDFTAEARTLREENSALESMVLDEFGKIGIEEGKILIGVTENAAEHRSIHRRLDRNEDKLDKIYDLLIKDKRARKQ